MTDTEECPNCDAMMTYDHLRNCWYCRLCGYSESAFTEDNSEKRSYIG